MMSGISFFIKRHVFTWMIMAALVFFGGVAFTRLGVSEFPDVDFPVVNVQVRWEGASPELMEVQIVTAIEDAVSSVEGITKVYATASAQQASITVEFDLDKDIDAAVQEVQSAIARTQRLLPREIEPPIVSKSNPEDRPIMWLTITSKTHSKEDLMRIVRDKIRPQFSMVNGVAEVMLGGFSTPAILVRPDPDRLNRLDFTSMDILNTVAQEHVELPAGRLESPTQEWALRTFGEAQSLEGLRTLPIVKRGGAPNYKSTRLGDVASVEVGLENTRFRARAMGQSAIGLGFKKQRGSNAVAVGNDVVQKMKEIQSQFDESDIQIGVNFDSTAYIKDAIHEMGFTLIFAAILTSLVCWLFLGQIGITINVILAIPTAIIGTFSVLYIMGYTLNTFTLLALSLAIGIVVDDAIMVLENIMRHLKMGKSPFEAAHEGTKEIFFAVIATTTVLLAIFLPVIYLQGIIGVYMLQFGITLCVAVALSLVEAVTLTPMRCAGLLKQAQSEHRTWMDGAMLTLESWYRSILVIALRWRVTTLAFTVGIVGVMLCASSGIRQEFIPYQDSNRIVLILRAPLGISIEKMDKKFKAVERIIGKDPDISRYFGFIGGSAPNTGRIFLQLKPKSERSTLNGHPRGQRDIADDLRAEFKSLKGLIVLVQDNPNRAFMDRTGYPIEVSIRGADWAKLSAGAAAIQGYMKTLPSLVDVETDYRTGLPEIQIIPNRIAAEKYGVSVADINRTIQTMMGGSVAGKYTLDGYRYDIRVWLAPEFRAGKTDVLSLYVRNNRGENVSLSKLVTLKETRTLQSINRENKERAITLTANLAENASQSDAIQSIEQFSKSALPQGYHAVFSGTTAAFSETFQQLALALGLGVIAAYMILAAQFNSFLRPLVILTAVPFSIIGVFVVLKWAGQSLNLFSMIGLILVVGLALKNTIILVDFTVQREREGESQQDALLSACPLRLRPILMTTFATIAGALPAAIALGPGAESRIPMALAVIGGIGVAMIFSLIIVPVLYSLVIPRMREETR